MLDLMTGLKYKILVYIYFCIYLNEPHRVIPQALNVFNSKTGELLYHL